MQCMDIFGILRYMKTTHFPPLKKTLLQLLGPSIIFVAISLNGGELLLWPNLAANFTLKILWAIPIVLTLQFFVNIEIERYALVTGNSTEENLVGNIRWLAGLFAFSVIISLVWPAWMSTAGNIITELFFSESSNEIKRNIGLYITIALLLVSILVFKSKKSYTVIEQISKYGLLVAISIIILTVALNFNASIFFEGLSGLFAWGYIPENLPRFDFLAALAYGGVAGVLNLAQSEWIIDKKYGAAELPENERNNINYESKRSKKNFKKWFRTVNQEHFLLFFLANLFSIFLLSYLGRILIPVGQTDGFGVLASEIHILNTQIPFSGFLFGISGILLFTMANIAILDAIGKLLKSILKPLQKNIQRPFIKNISANNLSIISIFLGIGILLLSLVFPSFKQPFILLVISASLSAIIMWLYPPLLLKMNLKLPKSTRPSWIRISALILCTLFYGIVSAWALLSIIPSWLVFGGVALVTTYQIYFLIKK